jgi:predicted amidophosphoribosyltransferase
VLDALLRLLVPPRCLACGAAARDALCAACRAALPWLRDVCPRCALPRPCAPCPAARQAFAAAWAPVAYEGSARALVHTLKFHAHLAAADVMAAQMAVALARAAPPEAPGAAAREAAAPLVPVPFAPGRRRARGFDPAELLARRLSARTGRPVVRCLARSGDAPRQVGSARATRLRAGGVVADGRAPPAALLVDDVHTTGGTLDACARALARVGTRTVSAVTYARTVRRA